MADGNCCETLDGRNFVRPRRLCVAAKIFARCERNYRLPHNWRKRKRLAVIIEQGRSYEERRHIWRNLRHFRSARMTMAAGIFRWSPTVHSLAIGAFGSSRKATRMLALFASASSLSSDLMQALLAFGKGLSVGDNGAAEDVEGT
ncbi:hypothetical protein TAL182_PD00375 (plasmid) [Rhizobium sp. TAL182]|nr:hypothetical protein TAL182_PD00375 [Rhizobium sp. TAL182]